MTHFHITTEQRTYNSVDSAEHFKTVRQNWNDQSAVIDAWTWTENGWQKVDFAPFSPEPKAVEK